MYAYMDFLERNWWVLLVRGIAAIVFGIAAFAWPAPTIAILVMLFGAYVLVDGVFGVVEAIRYRNRMDRWWVWLLEGALGIVVGALMLFMPGVTAYFLLMFIAFWAIFGGILRIVAAIQLRRAISGEWLLGLGGALSILFGVLLIAMPGAGILSLLWLIAIWAVLLGVVFIFLGLRLRKSGTARADKTRV